MTAENNAKKIMRMFVNRGMKPGDQMAVAMVQVNTIALGIEDLDAAVEFAGNNGWVELNANFVRFTDAGYAAGGGT